VHVLAVGFSIRGVKRVDDAVEAFFFRVVPVQHADHGGLAIDAADRKKPNVAPAFEKRAENDEGNGQEKSKEEDGEKGHAEELAHVGANIKSEVLFPMTFPILFIGHGSPLNAVADNAFTKTLSALGRSLPRPQAILCFSAHWQSAGFQVQSGAQPQTIHDFEGFPPELYQIRYPAPGAPKLAARVAGMLAGFGAKPTEEWGFDHGMWSVLVHLFPEANIPVTAVSLNIEADPRAHYFLGAQLAPLREEGVLLMGSGNIVHNLRKLDWNNRNAAPYPWTSAFDTAVRDALLARDHERLIDFPNLPNAALAHPTTEHFLPLLPVLGAAGQEIPSFPCEGFEHASLSMRMVRWG